MPTPIYATQVLAAMPAFMAALYSDIPTVIQKDGPSPDSSSPLAGWRPGLPTTAFIVDIREAEPVDDRVGDFENIWVRYWMQIAYVKPQAADPGRWDEDPDIREKRQTIRDAIYQPTFAAVAGVIDVRYKSGEVYDVIEAGMPIIISLMHVSFLTLEPRTFTAA